ncbi:MAG: DUF5320 domain-containing protein [Sedimentisphaeraceae bacterium JB056]
MPGFDGTGPMGKGPLTGRQMGNCRQPQTAFSGGRGFGRGMGRGLGAGRNSGLRRGFAAVADQSFQSSTDREAIETLAARVEQLEAELTQLREHD